MMAEEGEMRDCHPTKSKEGAMQPRICMLESRSVQGCMLRQVVAM